MQVFGILHKISVVRAEWILCFDRTIYSREHNACHDSLDNAADNPSREERKRDRLDGIGYQAWRRKKYAYAQTKTLIFKQLNEGSLKYL